MNSRFLNEPSDSVMVLEEYLLSQYADLTENLPKLVLVAYIHLHNLGNWDANNCNNTLLTEQGK